MTEHNLPELPEPVRMGTDCDSTMRYFARHGYTEDQMHAYARAAVEQATKPAWNRVLDEWIGRLKRQSDNGQFLNIPSGMSAGELYGLAQDLESIKKLSTAAVPARDAAGDSDFRKMMKGYPYG